MANINPGLDGSGNGNNWAPVNINFYTSSSTTYDVMTDVPTLTSATVANYATLNPLSPSSISATIADGNLKATGISTSTFESAISTMSFNSGKIYFEATCLAGTSSNSAAFIGITNISNATSGSCFTNSGSGSIGWDINGTTLYTIINTTTTNRGAITATNKVFRVAYDSSTGNIWLGYDTTWIGGGDPSTLTTPTGTLSTGVEYIAGVSINTTNDSVAFNFGQRPFAQTIPTGFSTLNTYNLPTPTIGATASSQANKYFDATLYTGNNTTNVITNSGSFQPDFLWIKVRSTSGNHSLFNSTSGVNKVLSSSLTMAEETPTAGSGLLSFNSNGFTLGTDISGVTGGETNGNGFTLVGWQWKANGGSTTSNTNGSITSTVQANTTSGFSVVTYTGTGSNATVGHGLGVAPKMVIVKKRSASDSWQVYHASLTSAAYRLVLNDTAAQTSTPTIWNSTAPTSTVFSIGTDSGVNTNTGTYVAYCFSEVAGFSKFGSYTGNGSTDGPFVYTGFRPKYLVLKNTSAIGGWVILDSSRSTYNVVGRELTTNSSGAEGSGYTDADFLSNGFKLRVAADPNASSGAYIYMAFAESPFKYANAR